MQEFDLCLVAGKGRSSHKLTSVHRATRNHLTAAPAPSVRAARLWRYQMRTRVGTVVVVVWLLIGLAAAIQRDYFRGSEANCAELGNIAVTVVAGPLNYVGVNPKIKCEVEVPQPSK
jgi:hypothetical protein